MLRRTWPMRQRISFLTDVEGDMAYFERFVAISRGVRWERRDGESAASAALPTATTSADGSPALTVADLRQRYRLGFTDNTTHFVFGGDAFDHGPDLSVAQALLDFKQRHPDRVHLILGNRDLNKMVMAPMALMSGAMRGPTPPFVDDMTPDQRGDLLFPVHLHANRPGGVRFVSYGAYLASSGAEGAELSAVSPVTMMRWALSFKLGSPNAFEHRRRELARLRAAGHHDLVEEFIHSPLLKAPAACQCTTQSSSSTTVTDEEVASSFFRAAQPGGVYYEYIRQAQLATCLHGILFVHGGLTEQNLGVIPSTDAAVPEAAWTRVGPLATASAADMDARAWLSALDDFKEACWRQWDGFWWPSAPRRAPPTLQDVQLKSGEPLRTYVYPREVVPYSITVASPIHQDGPSFAPLPVVHYLLSSGLHMVCSGHQPCGELPAVVRQPPSGDFFLIIADNSYCGHARAAHLCTANNPRGRAVSEVLFTVDNDVDTGDGAAETAAAEPVQSTRLHGRDALGVAFDFDIQRDALIGTGLPDKWWVRSCHRDSGASSSAPTTPMTYDVVRTLDGFRTIECRTESEDALRARCADAARQRSQHREHQVGGALRDAYTKAELAEVHTHRLKTKVPSSL